MSPIRKSFNVLVLVLDYQAKRTENGTSVDVWNALFLVTHKLAAIQNRFYAEKESHNSNSEENILNLGITELNISSNSSVPFNDPFLGIEKVAVSDELDLEVEKQAAKSLETHGHFENLPVEILMLIVSHIKRQDTLCKLPLLNRRLYRLMTPCLYATPILTSPTSISCFLSSLNCHSSKLVKTVIFSPSKIGSLANPSISNPKFETIPLVHSGLFNLLIDSRDKTSEGALVHPVFYQFGKCLPSCNSFEEHVYHKENRESASGSPSYISSQSVSPSGGIYISKVPSSSLTLSFLLRSCQRWFRDFPEWNGMKDSLLDCFMTIKLLLGWLQGDFHPIWHQVGGAVVRSIKNLVQNKCRAVLAHLNTTLLLQVRFITGNSQRLLDCYCIIYYRVLSMAQNLIVQGLSNAMNNEKKSSAFRGNHNDKVDMDLDGLISNSLSQNQQVARRIYEALIFIFHFRIPEELRTADKIPNIPVEVLQSILVTFPPSSINAETAEFIGNLLGQKLDTNDPTSAVLKPWLQWLDEIVYWYEASLEMEPVKDLLRKSMAKIDILRTMQRRYGINFMDCPNTL